MPLIDMPLEKLKTYMGSSPKPADFDEFWDRSLTEMRSIEPRPAYRRVETGSRFAECYELTFRSTKQAVIYAKFVRPRQAQGLLPVLLHFHGLSGSSDSWKSLYAYASQGYAVASMDCRGQGGKSEDVGGTKGTTFSSPFSRGLDGPPEDLLCRDLFLDTAMLARVVTMRPDVDSERIGVFGGSQGGGLALACAALVPEVKLCAPCYPYLSDYRRVWNMDLDKGAYEGLRYYFRNCDPLHEREEEIFLKLGYIDVQNLAPRIRARVLMGTGLMDTTCPPSTQFAVYNKITSPKEMLVYPDYAHETPKSHDDRVFAFLAEL